MLVRNHRVVLLFISAFIGGIAVPVFFAFQGVRTAQAAEGVVAVIGCSYTGEEVEGYHRVSSENVLARVSFDELAGFSLSDWAGGAVEAWQTVQAHEPAGGYEGAWVQICIDNAEREGGEVTAEQKEQLQSVLERLRADYGLYPREIYVSGENSYKPSDLCGSRKVSSSVSSELADWASAVLGARRGPDLGPFDISQTEGDQCSLSSGGEEYAGRQLVDYFDGDGPPSAPVPALRVELFPMVLPGGEPKVVFVALVQGTVLGRINYTFYCDNRMPGTQVSPGWDVQYLGSAAEASAALCSYPGLGGPYTAKVIAERGKLAAEDRLIFDLK